MLECFLEWMEREPTGENGISVHPKTGLKTFTFSEGSHCQAYLQVARDDLQEQFERRQAKQK
jgi:hypothetical protein